MIKLPNWLKQYGTHTIDMGLTRVKSSLNKLGNPEKQIPPVIHVAGTNGKGSTIAFLRSIFSSAGYRVHQYTSPHLLQFNERIVINNKKITDHQLYEVLEECRVKSQGIPLTFFESITVAAFLAFAKFSADIVLLETGLGGKYDATNVIDNVLMSIITPISLDHIEYLGNTVLKIAKEKAGIIKNSSTCVISWQEEEIINYLINKCHSIGANSIAFKKDWCIKKVDNGFEFIDFLRSKKTIFPMPKLLGIHQIINAATSICAVKNLANKFYITNGHIKKGISYVNWPGRMEKILNQTLISLLPKNSEIWFDGAHNTMGAQMIAKTFDIMTKMITFMIHGRGKDKDIEGFLLPFQNQIQLLIAIPLINHITSEDPNKIVVSGRNLGIKSIQCKSLIAAITYSIKNSQNNAVRIIICGSLYLAYDLQNYLNNDLKIYSKSF